MRLCTYMSKECDVPVITRCLRIAEARLTEVLTRGGLLGAPPKKARRIEVPPPHNKCLKHLLDQVRAVLRGECFYVLCDKFRGVGELTNAVDCGLGMLGRSPRGFHRGDVLLHGKLCLVVIIEVTERERKKELALEQLRNLFSFVEELISRNIISQWLDKCTNKPKSLKINPTSSPHMNLWKTCGGLGIAVLPKPIDIPNYKGFVLTRQQKRIRRLVLENRPYILLLTKKDIEEGVGLMKFVKRKS